MSSPSQARSDRDAGPKRGVVRPSLIVGLLSFIAVVFLPSWLNDADTYWHVAAGDWILSHHAVPLRDPFSWTCFGQPWSAHEWLAEVWFAVAFHLAGWAGIVLLGAVAVATGFYFLARAVEITLPPLGIVIAILCVGCTVAPGLLARPHILAFPVLVFWCASLIGARREGRTPSVFLLPVMTLWANLHGGYMVGLVLTAALGLEAVWTAGVNRIESARRWGGFLIGAILAAMLNPQGWHGLVFPFTLLRLHSLSLITEWRPIDFSTLEPIEVLIPAGLYLMIVRGVRLPLYRLSILVCLGWSAVEHSRNQMLFGLIGALFLAAVVDRRRDAYAIKSRFGPLIVCAVAAMVFSARLALPIDRPNDRPNGEATPVNALGAVASSIRSQPVFNDYWFGGYLIFNHIKPFVDGRLDMYGDAFMNRYDALIHGGPVLQDYLSHGPVTWALLRPDTGAVKTLDAMPQWRRVYYDKYAILYEKVP